MCTVTFIPAGDGCYITSNRDEKHWRKPAIPPQEYTFNGIKLIFPKDADAGGTWIAMKNNGDAAVLLNGAFKKHIPAPPYRKSRGLILLDIFSASQPADTFSKVSLNNIEPFTLILFVEGNLYECRWDGTGKHVNALDCKLAHIWSSATLYNDEVSKKRERWFRQWLIQNTWPTQRQVLDFHRFGGEGDAYNDLRMNRDGAVFTVSITGIAVCHNKASMHYVDLQQTNQRYTQQAAIINNLAAV